MLKISKINGEVVVELVKVINPITVDGVQCNVVLAKLLEEKSVRDHYIYAVLETKFSRKGMLVHMSDLYFARLSITRNLHTNGVIATTCKEIDPITAKTVIKTHHNNLLIDKAEVTAIREESDYLTLLAKTNGIVFKMTTRGSLTDYCKKHLGIGDLIDVKLAQRCYSIKNFESKGYPYLVDYYVLKLHKSSK